MRTLASKIKGPSAIIAYSAAILVTLSLSIHNYIHDLALLMLPVLFMVNYSFDLSDKRLAYKQLILVVANFIVYIPLFVLLLGNIESCIEILLLISAYWLIKLDLNYQEPRLGKYKQAS